jgi:hypothetical protein
MAVYNVCWRDDTWIAPGNDRPRTLVRVLVAYPMLARIHAQDNAYAVVANDQIREEFGRWVKLAAELPDDAWLVGVYSCPSIDGVFFIYWSSEFAPVEEGGIIPMLAEAYAH